MNDDFLQHNGVEFYSNDADFDMKFNTFKSKYFEYKNQINDLLTIYSNNGSLYLTNKNKESFLTIHNIMHLVLIYHDFWLCQKKSLLITAEQILEKYKYIDMNQINSLVNEQLNIYISAFIFVNSYYSLGKYDIFIQNILEFIYYYESYCKNIYKNMIEMIEFEEAFTNLSL